MMGMNLHHHTQLLSVAETLKCLGIGRTKLYQLANSGSITGVKLGRRTLFRAADLDSYIAGLAEYKGTASERKVAHQ